MRATRSTARSASEAGTSVAARDAADPSKYRWDIVLMG